MSRARDLSKLGNPNIIKADENSVGFGTQVPENPANTASSLISAGIVTAAQFFGDGSNLEGVASAGLGTAVDDTKDSIGQNIYFTNAELLINENTTVNAPDTSNIAYTQYQQITVDSGSELIIADGDSFIPDVLGIGTALQASTAGAGNGLFGTVFVDNIENVAGRGGPNFPLGMTVSGVSTFSGSVSIGGTLTYEDVTNVDSIGIVTARSGIDITGASAGVNGSSNLTLKTGGTERLRIDSLGNILGAGGQLRLKAAVGDSNGLKLYQGGSDTSYILNHYSGPLVLGTVNTERLRIGTAGQIGIAGANYGTSGQVLTSQGSGAAVQWATPSGGLSMSDWWYLRNPVDGSSVNAVYDDVIMGDWASHSNNLKWFRYEEQYGVGHVGAAMTVSSAGVFTFPTTGVYKIHARLGWPDGGTSNQRSTNSIQSTTDGASFNNVAGGNFTTAGGDSKNSAEIFLHSFNVTNTATHKIRLKAEMGSNSFTTYDGGSADMRTGAYYGVYKFMSFQKIN